AAACGPCGGGCQRRLPIPSWAHREQKIRARPGFRQLAGGDWLDKGTQLEHIEKPRTSNLQHQGCHTCGVIGVKRLDFAPLGPPRVVTSKSSVSRIRTASRMVGRDTP